MTDHGRGAQPYLGLADLFGVYFPPQESVYLVPVDAVGAHEGRLRLEPTRNNQRRRVRLAADYEIERWTPNALRELVEVQALVQARQIQLTPVELRLPSSRRNIPRI
jgi:hypothetical protein